VKVLQRKHILVTGANGFIGGRLAERLIAEGASVRAMVRTQPHAGSLNDAEIIIGDITDDDAARRAAHGCYAVIHCAALTGRASMAEFRRVNVGGTLNLLRAARDANVSRFVHISTINVHGYPPPSDANAGSPLTFHGDWYSISKSEGERAVWEFSKRCQLPITVIRPACTFGPRSAAWTLTPLRRVRRGSRVLIGKGDGICNPVYIDNLVDLILLAVDRDTAIGQAFIGAEGRGVTWREFYGAYANMAGIRRLRSVPHNIALTMATASELITRITGRAPFITRHSVAFYSHTVIYDIDKSHELLGYQPSVSFEQGMAKTRDWLSENGLLNPDT
jgi:nucleoside-diphosphate-sugar epimerase